MKQILKVLLVILSLTLVFSSSYAYDEINETAKQNIQDNFSTTQDELNIFFNDIETLAVFAIALMGLGIAARCFMIQTSADIDRIKNLVYLLIIIVLIVGEGPDLYRHVLSVNLKSIFEITVLS